MTRLREGYADDKPRLTRPLSVWDYIPITPPGGGTKEETMTTEIDRTEAAAPAAEAPSAAGTLRKAKKGVKKGKGGGKAAAKKGAKAPTPAQLAKRAAALKKTIAKAEANVGMFSRWLKANQAKVATAKAALAKLGKAKAA